MVVMILENVPPSLRGELTRWLIEPRPDPQGSFPHLVMW